MPQKSYVFATGSVRVREGRMMSQERIERMLSSQNPMDSIKTLQEAGYGRGEDVSSAHDYEEWLNRQSDELYSFVRQVTPEPASSDCFLLRKDYKNAQALYKAKMLGGEETPVLSEGGLLDPEIISASIREQDYARLPEEMQKALKQLDALSLSALEPRTIDIELDKALFAQIERNLKKAKSKPVKEYFTDLADLTNLRSALRARQMRLSRELYRDQFVAGGAIPYERMAEVMDEPERVSIAFAGKDYKRLAEEAVAAYQQGEGLGKLEKFMDNQLLKTIKKGQWNMNAVEPVIGYMLGMEREMAAIRLIMVGQINGFPQESVRERLGDLYV